MSARRKSDQGKKHRVVVVMDRLINNFDVLGTHIHLTNDIEVLIHFDKRVNMRGTDVNFNFDIMISNDKHDGVPYDRLLPSHRYVPLPRHDKFTQAALIARWSETLKDTAMFKPVPTWYVGTDASRNLPATTGRVVVKPLDGARGIGQFVVDVDKVHLAHFQARLGDYICGVITAEEGKKLSVAEFLERFQGAVTYHPGEENHDGEGLDSLRTQGAVVQSVIENVVVEYRIITGADATPVYVQRRGIREQTSVFPQATGSGYHLNPNDQCELEDVFGTPGSLEAFLELCRVVIGPMNSVDLFIMEDGRWGVFEFCNQFGITGLPSQVAEKIHREFLLSVVNNYLVIENP